MKNEIYIRQNEDKAIDYLAAQRQLYNEAKRFCGVEIVVAVLLPLGLAILQSVWKTNIYINIASSVCVILSMLLSNIITTYIAKRKEQAAEIQQKFDLYVYQMPWDSKLFGNEKSLTSVVAEKSKVFLSKDGERDKLLNWYTIGVNMTSLEHGIWICQKENFHWDVSLRKRYKLLCSLILVVSISIVFGVGVINDEKVAMLIYRIAFIVPILQWFTNTINQLKVDIQTLRELDESFYCFDKKNMEELQEIQSKIFRHRKTCYTIPNFFYEIFKNNDEDVAHRTAILDRGGM